MNQCQPVNLSKQTNKKTNEWTKKVNTLKFKLETRKKSYNIIHDRVRIQKDYWKNHTRWKMLKNTYKVSDKSPKNQLHSYKVKKLDLTVHVSIWLFNWLHSRYVTCKWSFQKSNVLLRWLTEILCPKEKRFIVFTNKTMPGGKSFVSGKIFQKKPFRWKWARWKKYQNQIPEANTATV